MCGTSCCHRDLIWEQRRRASEEASRLIQCFNCVLVLEGGTTELTEENLKNSIQCENWLKYRLKSQTGSETVPAVCRLRPSAALIQARAVNLHLAQTQELLRVRDDDVDVATVRSLTVELGLCACWDICDHSAPVRGSRGEELQVFIKSPQKNVSDGLTSF